MPQLSPHSALLNFMLMCLYLFTMTSVLYYLKPKQSNTNVQNKGNTDGVMLNRTSLLFF
uniref:ATP synthase subunit 8 n=1 Tax=Cerion tridentatum costellata TaxID=1108932 RepID=A0A1W6Q5G3_9EUPU|nr:ATP synthase subunit 8 [Cerion tridentatum costellata]